MLVSSLPLLYWTNIEYNMGMVAGSMGTLRPLLSKLFVGFAARYSGGSSSSGEQAKSYRMFSRARGGAPSRVQGDSVLQTATTGTQGSVTTSRMEEDVEVYRGLPELPPFAAGIQSGVEAYDFGATHIEIGVAISRR